MTLLLLTALACIQAQAQAKRAGDDAALLEAVKRGDPAAVKSLLAAGASPDASDDEDVPALVLSMRGQSTEVFEALLAAGADVNKRDGEGEPLIVIAASSGRAAFVRSLLTRGARVGDTDRGGHSPLMVASFGRLKRDLPREVLIAFGLGEGEVNELYGRMGDEQMEIIALLIEAGARLDHRAHDCGMSALVVASLFADTEVVKVLLAHGADPNMGEQNWTPLRLATMTVGEMEKQLDGDETEESEKRPFLKWFGQTTPARREIARLLREAGATR